MYMDSSILMILFAFFSYLMLQDCGSVLRPHPPSALYRIHFSLIGLSWSPEDLNKLSFFLCVCVCARACAYLHHTKQWTQINYLNESH